jgi:hypothetical protein
MDDVTLILSVYKRPYTFEEQYAAIKRQTHKDINIVIWINKAEGVDVPDSIMKLPEVVYSEQNGGTWGRFNLARQYNTKYISIIDDDTIPGSKWIENCIETIKKHPGVITPRGIIAEYGKDHTYPLPQSYTAYGWCNPTEQAIEVDMSCQSHFFETTLLNDFWKYAPDPLPMDHGEDTHISFVSQINEMGTFVAPHPKDDLEMWGSNPSTANNYGSDKNAISWSAKANTGMNRYWNFVRKSGYKILAEK